MSRGRAAVIFRRGTPLPSRRRHREPVEGRPPFAARWRGSPARSISSPPTGRAAGPASPPRPSAASATRRRRCWSASTAPSSAYAAVSANAALCVNTLAADQTGIAARLRGAHADGRALRGRRLDHPRHRRAGAPRGAHRLRLPHRRPSPGGHPRRALLRGRGRSPSRATGTASSTPTGAITRCRSARRPRARPRPEAGFRGDARDDEGRRSPAERRPSW